MHEISVADALNEPIYAVLWRKHRCVCLKPCATAGAALKAMLESRIGCVMVTDECGCPAGIFTERDALRLFSTQRYDASDALESVMTPRPQTVEFDAPMSYALNLMIVEGFRHVPCVDAGGRLADIVSMRDAVLHWERLSRSLSHVRGIDYAYVDGECTQLGLPDSERLEKRCEICLDEVLSRPAAELLPGGCSVSDLTLAPSAAVQEAAGLMLSSGVGAVMIQRNGELAGIFTERDVLRLMHQGVRRKRGLKRFMTRQPATVAADAEVGAVVALMAEQGYRHVPCVGDDGAVVGLVSMKDVVEFWLSVDPALILCLPPDHKQVPRQAEGG